MTVVGNLKLRNASRRRGKNEFNDRSPVMAYRDLVSQSSDRFRADVEFHEKPRQVLIGVLLLLILGWFSRFNIDTEISVSHAPRAAFLGVLVIIVFYCMLQSKDGLMIRPHPMLWRALHGLALTYLLFLGVVLILPPSLGVSFIHDALFPDISGGSVQVFALQQSAAVPHLDKMECVINMSNVLRQISSIWFFAHVFGWWGKMCLLRDWSMCLQYSIAFEVMELSLVWLIPEFQECWWDSLIMDMLGANMLGLYLGTLTLKWLSCRNYEWESCNKKKPLLQHFSSVLNMFTPFSWSEYVWPNDPKSRILSSITWIGALVLEINSFIILHALLIRPTHWFNFARICLLGAQGAQSVPEWYEYVRGNTERIGHNIWLLFVIAVLELMIGYKYGRGGRSFGQTIPPIETALCLGGFAVLWLLWYSISAYRGIKGERRARNWLVFLHVISFIPLLFLTKQWVY